MVRDVVFTPVTLNPESPFPLYRQLYDELRQAILTGRLASGVRLPSTRTLADLLGISRNTVVGAFDQLFAEGYLESRQGDGTYIAEALPDDLARAVPGQERKPPTKPIGRQLSERGALLAAAGVDRSHPVPTYKHPCAFRNGIPALDKFPFEGWNRLTARHRGTYGLMTYGDSAGYPPLREAISAYLRGARAVHCSPEQIIIVSGAQQAFDLAVRLLLDPGDAVWMENPGYTAARGVFSASGARLVPVPVDDEGLIVEAGITACPDARMAYVSPSHQHPLGVTMSLARRLALLEWANQAGAWVLEDDYDSEYRYASRPLAALQGLDKANHVIYIGTFSKVLFPALRLGYMVVPPDLIEPFRAARTLTDRHSPLLEQAILADFISEGYFARHIRRMRALYAKRQAVLVDAAARITGAWLDVHPSEAGMHLMGWLRDGFNDQRVSERALHYGVEVKPLSGYSLAAVPRGGLILGYAALDQAAIVSGLEQLARALRDCL